MTWPLIYNNTFKFTESTELYELRVVAQVHINGLEKAYSQERRPFFSYIKSHSAYEQNLCEILVMPYFNLFFL